MYLHCRLRRSFRGTVIDLDGLAKAGKAFDRPDLRASRILRLIPTAHKEYCLKSK